jgi:hypothetical protein
MYNVLRLNSPHLYYSLTLLLFLFPLIMLFLNIYMMYFDHIHPSDLSFPLSLSSWFSSTNNSPFYDHILSLLLLLLLGLDSAFMQKHVIFAFLSLTYLIQHDDVWFHPFACKWHNFILPYGWIILHCAFILHLLSPFISC